MREIEDAVRAFARNDNFLANNPPQVVFNGFTVAGYVLEERLGGGSAAWPAHESVTGSPPECFTSLAYLDARVHALYDRVPALCTVQRARGSMVWTSGSISTRSSASRGRWPCSWRNGAGSSPPEAAPAPD